MEVLSKFRICISSPAGTFENSPPIHFISATNLGTGLAGLITVPLTIGCLACHREPPDTRMAKVPAFIGSAGASPHRRSQPSCLDFV